MKITKPRIVEHIDELRIELGKLIDQKELSSEEVIKLSRELDQLILMYYETEGKSEKKI